MQIFYKFLILVLKIVASSWRISINQSYGEANSGEIGGFFNKKSKKNTKKSAIIAFWHGEMLPIWKIFSKTNSFAIVSLSKDGEILSHLLKSWKYQLFRGSSSRNGSEIIDEIMHSNTKNSLLLLTPDGPRGPRMQCKAGAFAIAQRKQVPLYFLRCSINSKHIFVKSWDRFEFPLPFSKIEISISQAIKIPAEFDKNSVNSLISKCEKKFSL